MTKRATAHTLVRDIQNTKPKRKLFPLVRYLTWNCHEVKSILAAEANMLAG